MDVHGTRVRDLLEMDVEKGLGDEEEEEELTFSAMLEADLGEGRRGMGVQRTSSTTLTGDEHGVAKVGEEKVESGERSPMDPDRP